MSVLSVRMRVHLLPEEVISSASNTYTKKAKRLGMGILPLGRLKMAIFTYSNILLSVSLINITNGRVRWRPSSATSTVWSTCTKPPKRRGTLGAYSGHTRTTTPNVYNTSSTTTVLSHAIGDTRTELYTPHNKYTHKERERERKKEKHKTKLANNKIWLSIFYTSIAGKCRHQTMSPCTSNITSDTRFLTSRVLLSLLIPSKAARGSHAALLCELKSWWTFAVAFRYFSQTTALFPPPRWISFLPSFVPKDTTT